MNVLAPSRAVRWVIGLLLGACFLLPLVSTFLFTLRDGDGTSGIHWLQLFDPPRAHIYKPVWTALTNSLILAVLTVALVLLLLAPTMILVNLRFGRLRRSFEFFVLLPISIPAIVLVVGLSPIYRTIGHTLGTGAWTLFLAYGITVLPYAFRSIQASLDAVDIRTLSEAARSLGADWPQVVVRVLVPNLRAGLLAASLITTAVVLGEFTIASLLNRQVLQTALLVVGKADSSAASVFTLLSLGFAFGLLVVIGRLGRAGAPRSSS
jgi:putative spermidine/putrescine transport system permease protein